MSSLRLASLESHVSDVLSSTRGRDQTLMTLGQAARLVETLNLKTFSSGNAVFLDPFCKAGETLLALAVALVAKSAGATLSLNLEDVRAVFAKDSIYGLALDERHYRLSLRTFFGNVRSHNLETTAAIKQGNYLTEDAGVLVQKNFKKEFSSMLEFIKKKHGPKRLVCVGNPPYHEADGAGGGSSAAIYPFFVEHLLDCAEVDEFSVVIPARWFSSGRGVDDFRDRIKNSPHIADLVYFQNPEEVFPTINLQGGLCFLHVDKQHRGLTRYQYKGQTHEVDLKKYDIIPDDPASMPIIDKVLKVSSGKFVSQLAWPNKPFGLRTNHFKKSQQQMGPGERVRCLTKGKKITEINRKEITVREEHIDRYKVMVPAAMGRSGRCTLRSEHIFVLGRGCVSTESYNVVASFEDESEAKNFAKYMQTSFVRYLLGQRKMTQHISRSVWKWVPLLSTRRCWSDEELFVRFGLSESEKKHLFLKVREWQG